MPPPLRSFSNQVGHIPDAYLVDHDSIPRLTPHGGSSSGGILDKVGFTPH
jgi:hypothetical protein